MSVIAVIPARGGSKRLLRKNIYPVFGKPMIAWSIEACRRSAHIQEIFVSTEDAEIATVAHAYGAEVIDRPASLADDKTAKMEVIRHAGEWYLDRFKRHPEILVSVQANSPEIRHKDIDEGIDLLAKNSLWEVISVGKDNIQNASFRVIKQSILYNTFLSAHIGIVINDCMDVHTLADVTAIEKKYGNADALVNQVTH